MTESTPTMAGKTVLVTGATAGIGQIAAREIARRGAGVTVVGRSRDRAEATVAAIQAATGNPSVDYLLADMSSQADVRRLAAEVLARRDKLDVLLNNAGAYYAKRRETVDGIEMTWGLNHLGYFLLSNLLLPALKAAPAGRVVSVASDAHRMVGKVDLDDPEGKKKYGGWGAYCQSKLANIQFTTELARRLAGTGVTANCLHPGFVASNFTEGNGAMGWLLRRMAGLAAISPEEGAKTSVHLATSPEVEGSTGGYYSKCKLTTPTKPARDAAAAGRLWALSERMTGLG